MRLIYDAWFLNQGQIKVFMTDNCIIMQCKISALDIVSNLQNFFFHNKGQGQGHMTINPDVIGKDFISREYMPIVKSQSLIV